MKATFIMIKYLLLFIFLSSCIGEENNSNTPYEERATLITLNQEIAELDIFWEKPNFTGTPYLILKKENNFKDNLIVLTDTILVGEFVRTIGWTNFNKPYLGNVYGFIGDFHYNQQKLKVLVSGDLKVSHSKDTIPGLPFVLEKIEPSPPCPLQFLANNEIVSLQNTLWKWKGFVDENNQIYSFPTCENPLVTLKFTLEKMNFSGLSWINPLHPNALYLEQNTGFIQNYILDPVRVYEMDGNQLNIFSTYWYGSNLHPITPSLPTTRRTMEKADSLYNMMSKGKVEYILDSKQLLLIRRDKQIRALFIAD